MTSCVLTEEIDQALSSLIETDNQTLREAASYSLLAPGKRLRPKITILLAEALGAPTENALIPACTLELIHCYSLIHDLLPCMDDDDFRRGKPSLHRAFPEGIAVLTGDYLLTRAFEVLSDAPRLTDSQKVSLVRCLSQRCGGSGMIGGQILDIEATGKTIHPDHLDLIHRKKSADLLSAAALFAGIIAGADEATLISLEKFGQAFGLAFQITDDLLDFTNSVEKHGHEVSSDFSQGKTTYYTLYGEKQTRQKAIEQLQISLSHLPSPPLKEAISRLLTP